MRVMFRDETTCKGCDGAATRVIIQGIPGAKPASLTNCPSCDRSTCGKCKKPVHDIHVKDCPSCGAHLEWKPTAA